MYLMMRRRILVIALSAIVLSGCATVSPWQRGTLGKTEMGWSPDSLESTLDGHIYFAKEASSGGGSASGGGCGCN
jgi:hypothetical protein